jgi:hypothetical protein
VATQKNIKESPLRISKAVLIAVVSLLLFITAFCGYKVHHLSGRQVQLKEDYSVVNNISFGMLSISEWRDKIDTIITNRLQNFDFTPTQEAELEKEIEQILNALIDKAVSIINKPKKSLGGKIRKLAFKAFVNEDDLHKKVPVFAKKIMQEIKKPSSKERLANLIESKINQLEEETYDSAAYSKKMAIDAIFNKYHVNNKAAFQKKTTSSIAALVHDTYLYAFGMLVCVLIVLGIWRLIRNNQSLHTTLYIMSILLALVLLLVGLTTTMIEVDARIKTLNFHLIGENISFNNQVLFFQSKSILEVVNILLKTGHYDSIIVGILILCFSILFPIAKLLSTGIYLLGKKKWTKNKYVKYFAFKSGKWSMTDVMVVAILMTFIGFNGILESQLASLNIHNETVTGITTNNTALQPGYIVFTGFVIYELILSQILKSITHTKVE